MLRRCLLTAALAVGLFAAATSTASAAQRATTAIWGPVVYKDIDRLPQYQDLGVKIFQYRLDWSLIAPTKPADARDPSDPAYRWPAAVDDAVARGGRYGLRVLLQALYSPSWANGGHDRRWAPSPSAYADFLVAATKRYRSVHLWMIWGEPSRPENWQPEPNELSTTKVGSGAAATAATYARLLDHAYGVLKKQSARNTVIGGNTFTTGNISPYNWIRSMRLPNGKPPRMDLYGHNPFTTRRPDLTKPPLVKGWADFSDLDNLAGWLDKYLIRPGGKPLRIFISEFTLPTDQVNNVFNFWVTRATQASWLKSALGIARRWDRIYALGWINLVDPPLDTKTENGRIGLIDAGETKKPAYFVFQRG